MSLLQHLLLGVLSGVALIAALGTSLDGGPLLALVTTPLVFLALVALFGAGVPGWQARLARGVLGAALAAAAGVAFVLHFKDRSDWFDWHDEQGGLLWFLILVGLAAVPGGLAALTASPARGLALAVGFACGLHVLPLALGRGPINPGILLLLALGTTIGTLVSAPRHRRRCTLKNAPPERLAAGGGQRGARMPAARGGQRGARTHGPGGGRPAALSRARPPAAAVPGARAPRATTPTPTAPRAHPAVAPLGPGLGRARQRRELRVGRHAQHHLAILD